MAVETVCPVLGVQQVARNIFLLAFHSADISRAVRAGQFVNMKVADGPVPLLRRPFSVYRTEGETVEILFNVVGKGTAALRDKSPGDSIDVLGPLGVPFSVKAGGMGTAVLVGGGLGVAPLPITTAALAAAGTPIVTLLGARSADQLVEKHLVNTLVATDDGSKGCHGTVVDLARSALASGRYPRPRMFACGPTAMLRAVRALALELDIPCEASLEGPMGCGCGICQGCPVELVDADRKYGLMCKDGPVFDVRKIII